MSFSPKEYEGKSQASLLDRNAMELLKEVSLKDQTSTEIDINEPKTKVISKSLCSGEEIIGLSEVNNDEFNGRAATESPPETDIPNIESRVSNGDEHFESIPGSEVSINELNSSEDNDGVKLDLDLTTTEVVSNLTFKRNILRPFIYSFLRSILSSGKKTLKTLQIWLMKIILMKSENLSSITHFYITLLAMILER